MFALIKTLCEEHLSIYHMHHDSWYLVLLLVYLLIHIMLEYIVIVTVLSQNSVIIA